jgi:hypothetical protein
MQILRCLLLVWSAVSWARAAAPAPRCVDGISETEAAEIGRKIWMNEGGGKILAWWDETADCSSFGINNYLWFQAGSTMPFHESFPPFIEYAASKGAPAPAWVRASKHSPWKTRAEYFGETLAPDRIRANPPKDWGMTAAQFAKEDSPRMKELKDFLAKTVALQARFSIQRMIDSLPKMLALTAPENRANVAKQFNRVACSPGGGYDLVDYVNFKGEGVDPKERYKSPSGELQGWGLLQILEHMKGDVTGAAALNDFADSAEWALRRRVDNSPPERSKGDHEWLNAWLKRVQRYRGG